MRIEKSLQLSSHEKSLQFNTRKQNMCLENEPIFVEYVITNRDTMHFFGGKLSNLIANSANWCLVQHSIDLIGGMNSTLQ